MAFNLVDEETAKSGLENGTYYMVVTIPENFSQNASTLMDEKPQKMELDYETNPGKNYISMKLSESAMKEIKSNLTEEISKTYAETVFDSIQTIGDGFDDAIDGTKEMLDGEDALAEGNDKISDNLGTLASSTLTFKEGTDTLRNGIKTYTEGVSAVDSGLTEFGKGTKTFTKSVVPGTKKLADGASSLEKGLSSYLTGVEGVKTGSDSLKTGSANLLTGLQTLQTQMNNNLTADKINGINALSSEALPGIKQGINELYNGLQAVDLSAISSLGQLAPALYSANEYAASATGAVVQAKENVVVAAGNVGEAAGAVEQAKNYLSAIDTDEVTDDEIQKIIALLNDASSAIGNASGALGADGAAKQLAVAEGNLGGTSQTISAVAGGLTNMDPELGTKLNSLTGGVAALHDNAAYLDTASTTLQSLLGSLQGVQGALNATEKDNGSSGLVEGMQNLNTGIGSINTGLTTLVASNANMNTGVTTLKTGAQSLYSGVKTGTKKLDSGVDKLSKGTNQLVKNNSNLLDGAAKLSEGASKLSDGAGKLQDGSKELGEGLTRLQDGTKEMKSAMTDGKEEIRENKASDATLDMFVAPVEVKETQITKVENNGHAMAAYMFSVGLWVGCLAFCLMYPLAQYNGKLTSGRAWWASKAVILYPLGLMMVVLLLAILHRRIGFNPASMGKTFIVGIATVSAFMAIMYFFNLLFGKVGSFLMLIFMVLQLAGSAGTYPVEISGSLANVLHKWVPFTYSVDAFRAAIAENGPSVWSQCALLFTISIVFTFLTIIVFKIRARRVNAQKPIMYDWLEEKGLA